LKKATEKSAKTRPRGRPRVYRHRVLTNAEMCRRYRQRRKRSIHFRSDSSLWETPSALFEALHAEFGFTLDACAIAENAKCDRYFSPEDDGLQQDWGGQTVWCNPPYGIAIGRWVQKAYESAKAGALVVCLLPARVDTRWWHDYVIPYGEVRYLKGRLKFGGCGHSAPFPSAVVIFRPGREDEGHADRTDLDD
jgi:phage N-6-adenine-methyltransferase